MCLIQVTNLRIVVFLFLRLRNSELRWYTRSLPVHNPDINAHFPSRPLHFVLLLSGVCVTDYSHETRTPSLYRPWFKTYQQVSVRGQTEWCWSTSQEGRNLEHSRAGMWAKSTGAPPHHSNCPGNHTQDRMNSWIFNFIQYSHKAFYKGINNTRECAFPFIPNRAVEGKFTVSLCHTAIRPNWVNVLV